jgi:hypothetical protein
MSFTIWKYAMLQFFAIGVLNNKIIKINLIKKGQTQCLDTIEQNNYA